MDVFYAEWFERVWQGFLVKLWVMPAAGNRAHVHNQGDTVSFEQQDELVYGPG